MQIRWRHPLAMSSNFLRQTRYFPYWSWKHWLKPVLFQTCCLTRWDDFLWWRVDSSFLFLALQFVPCWCVCLLFLKPTLPTTWQGAARSRPTTQIWCGIKQLNHTKQANQKETNGNTWTWVFSCHKAVSKRWRGDRVVVQQSVITLRRQRKVKALIGFCSSLWAWPHRLSGQSWLTLKWQWREFRVSTFSCYAALPNW